MQIQFIHEVSNPGAIAAAGSCGALTLLLPSAATANSLRLHVRERAMRVGIFVAISSADSPELDAELDMLGPDLPDGVLLADCRGRADLQHLSVKLSVREALANRPEGAVRILAVAGQSPAGVLALSDLPGGTRRLAGLLWDPAALAQAIDVAPEASTVKMAGSQVVFAAAAAGVPAFFVASPLQDDDATLVRRCAQARRAGFAGAVLKTPAHFAAVRRRPDMIDKRP